MPGAEDRESATEQLLGLAGAAQFDEGDAVDSDVLGDEVMVGSELALADLHGSGSGRCGLLGLASGVGEPGEVVPQGCCRAVIGTTGGGDQFECFGAGDLRGVVAAGVLVEDAEGVEDEGAYRRSVSVVVGRGTCEGSGEDLFGHLELPLEADEVAELHEGHRQGGRAGGGPFEDVDLAPPCTGCRLEVSELSLAGGDDVVGGDQFRDEVAPVSQVSDRCGGVAQGILGSAQDGMTSGKSPAVASPPS
jgi:hypothetical protein